MRLYERFSNIMNLIIKKRCKGVTIFMPKKSTSKLGLTNFQERLKSFLEIQHFYVRLFLDNWTRQGTFWLSLLGEIYGFLQSLISISHLTGSSSRRDEQERAASAQQLYVYLRKSSYYWINLFSQLASSPYL